MLVHKQAHTYGIHVVPSVSPPVICGSGILGMLQGKEFPETPMGGCGIIESFIDVKLKSSLPRSHLPLSPHGKSSILSLAGLGLKPLPRVSTPY